MAPKAPKKNRESLLVWPRPRPRGGRIDHFKRFHDETSPREMAKLRGVSRQAAHAAVKPGGPLHDAVLPSGWVDKGHPAARRWLALGRTTKPRPKAARRARAAELDDDPAPDPRCPPDVFARVVDEPLETVLAAMQPGGRLAAAVNPDGTTIDSLHDDALRWWLPAALESTDRPEASPGNVN